MARNSSSLNISDFIPYPVRVRPVSDFYPKTDVNSSSESSTTGQSKSNSKPNASPSSGQVENSQNCPFDCCQKNLRNIFFPKQYSLTNATLRMKIAPSGNYGLSKMTEIPCFERRSIYKGKVTESPVKFEELIREVNGDKIILADQSTLKLTFHQGQSQPGGEKGAVGESKPKLFRMNPDSDTQYVWDSERCGWVSVEKEEAQGFSSSSESRIRYAAADWQNRNAQLYTAEEWKPANTAGAGGSSSNSNLRSSQQFWNHEIGNDEVRIAQVINGTPQNIKQQQQYYQQYQQQQQQQRSKISVTPIAMPGPNTGVEKSQASVITSVQSPRPRTYSAPASTDISLFDKEELLQMQLNAHLKSFKYLKPSLSAYMNANNATLSNNSPSATITRYGHPSSSPLNDNANNYYKTLNASSKTNFKQKNQIQDNKRVLSPKEALEQYERLRKYWDYQHKLLGSGAFDINNTNNYPPPPATITKSTMPNYSHYGPVSTASGYPLHLNASWKQSTSASAATSLQSQNYPPAALSYWNLNATASTATTGLAQHPYQRQGQISRAESAPSYYQGATSSRGVLKYAKSSNKVIPRSNSNNSDPSPRQVSPVNTDYQQQLRNLNKIMNIKKSSSSNANLEAMLRSDTMTFERLDNSEIEMPSDINNSTETTTNISAMVNEAIAGLDDEADSPKDLSIPRRQNDQASTPPPDLPERSKSTGSINDTYDHIVLLDSKSERVKTYMCKRCFETLKSEQEIRNHLFCKMLSDTVQCHVCRCLFKAEDYPEHLKVHAIKAI